MRYFQLIEYIDFSEEKLKSRLKDDKNHNLDINSDNLKNEFTELLASYDPTQNNKYVNWMISRYLNRGIRFLEDLPKLTEPLELYSRLVKSKKLKSEHRDINKYRTLSDFLDITDEYIEVKTSREEKSEIEQKLIDNDEVEILLNTSEYKVVIPKTERASCYYGRNTRWCTAGKRNNEFESYNEQGLLYTILHKPTNKRWQFHFEEGQFMDEKDNPINIPKFLSIHKPIYDLFENLGKVELENDSTRVGNKWYNKKGQFHRIVGPAITSYHKSGNVWTKQWWLNSQRHRIDGPAVTMYYNSGGIYLEEWYLNGRLHRTDGPAKIEYHPSGEIENIEWFLNGKRIYSEDWLEENGYEWPLDKQQQQELIKEFG